MEKGLCVEHAGNVKQTAEHLDKYLSKNEKRGKEEEKDKVKENGILQEQAVVMELTSPTSRVAEKLIKAKALEKQEQFCKISHALAILASASSVSKERQELLSLVNKETELYNTILKKVDAEGEAAMKAYKEARRKSDHAVEAAPEDKVSSVLRNKSRLTI